MPGARHSAAWASTACAGGNPISAGGDGKDAAKGNAGTEGDWSLCTDTDCCVQCHVHSGGAGFAWAIIMPWQGMVIVLLPAGISGITHGWQANASGWNNIDNTNSSVSRRRIRRHKWKRRFTGAL